MKLGFYVDELFNFAQYSSLTAHALKLKATFFTILLYMGIHCFVSLKKITNQKLQNYVRNFSIDSQSTFLRGDAFRFSGFSEGSIGT